jgi:hypothetical protein
MGYGKQLSGLAWVLLGMVWTEYGLLNDGWA